MIEAFFLSFYEHYIDLGSDQEGSGTSIVLTGCLPIAEILSTLVQALRPATDRQWLALLQEDLKPILFVNL